VFLEVLAAMKAAGYRVKAGVLDAQWLAVPQRRQRLFFVGVRGDLRSKRTGRLLQPALPAPLPWRWTVADALPWMVAQPADQLYPGNVGIMKDAGDVSRTITTGGASGSYVAEMIVGNDAFRPRWGGLDVPTPTIMSGGKHGGSGELRFRAVERSISGREADVTDAPCPTVRALSGRHLEIRPFSVAPSRMVDGAYEECLVDVDRPAPTVTCGSPENDVAVPDRDVVRRKFTIGEVKRLCGFPDDFVLLGPYAKQWERLGNSVPPPMAYWVGCCARVVLLEAAGREPWAPQRPELKVILEGGGP
jgi:DNA (cytosine-5)-methyltransferase 1